MFELVKKSAKNLFFLLQTLYNRLKQLHCIAFVFLLSRRYHIVALLFQIHFTVILILVSENGVYIVPSKFIKHSH